MKMQLHRVLATIGAVLLLGLVLACGSGTPLASGPTWACPSPIPLPYGESGPIKREWQECTIDPVTGVQTCETRREYFAEWEQEYGPGGSLLDGQPPFDGPDFPAPTPYGVKGTNFTLGQRVAVGPMHVLVSARSGPLVELPHIPANTQRLYSVELTWNNAAAEPIPFDYGASVRIRAVTSPEGRILTDSIWGMSNTSLQVSGSDMPPAAIPLGESHVTIPIIAPLDRVKTVELTFVGMPGHSPTMPTATTLPGTPTATPAPDLPTATPAPNDELRSQTPIELAVQWTDTQLSIGPACGDPGALTAWDTSGGWGQEAQLAIAAPPGASRVVQLALNQVGKRYVWGAKGPEVFDCSGLMTWSYARIGISIPQGTAGQWPRMRPVSAAEVQPGDLIFFTVESPSRIDHVGMLIGDLNGDGTWDMVHASAPCCGVRVEYDVFNRPFWQNKIAGFRTAR